MGAPSFLIYGLVDPRSGQLRYVGLHAGDLTKRLREHLCLARKGRKIYVYDWIRQVLSAGLNPGIVELEACGSEAEMREAEVWHIAYWRSLGCRLTNLTAGGEGALGYRHYDENRAKMSRAKKGKPWTKAQLEASRKISPEIELKMQQEYRMGLSCDAIAALYGYSRTGVTKVLVRNGVQIRNAAQQRWISTKMKKAAECLGENGAPCQD